MFRVVRRQAAASRKSVANELAFLRTSAVDEADALRILFDMITTEGPIPEIESGHGKAS
ncbi:MAG TPA: hypothetical protein VFI08_08130 [Spirochaetia bacterium]|nr:hypothetical protein [Spirochaetia bacterium]